MTHSPDRETSTGRETTTKKNQENADQQSWTTVLSIYFREYLKKLVSLALSTERLDPESNQAAMENRRRECATMVLEFLQTNTVVQRVLFNYNNQQTIVVPAGEFTAIDLHNLPPIVIHLSDGYQAITRTLVFTTYNSNYSPKKGKNFRHFCFFVEAARYEKTDRYTDEYATVEQRVSENLGHTFAMSDATFVSLSFPEISYLGIFSEYKNSFKHPLWEINDIFYSEDFGMTMNFRRKSKTSRENPATSSAGAVPSLMVQTKLQTITEESIL